MKNLQSEEEIDKEQKTRIERIEDFNISFEPDFKPE
jgi:hypothetical protein